MLEFFKNVLSVLLHIIGEIKTVSRENKLQAK